MKFLIVPLVLIISFLTAPVIADPYVGFGVGSATYTVDLSDLGASDFEKSGTGSKFYGGYAFNKYFAAEATYYNFAEVSVGAVETAPGSGTFVSAAADMRGIGAYAVGMYPFTKKFNLMAKLGMVSWDADIIVNTTKGSNDGTDASFAIGASYAFTKEFIGVAEWESFDSDNPELSMFTLGFEFIIK